MVANEEATALVRNTFSEVLYLVLVVGEIISVRAHLKLLLFQLYYHFFTLSDHLLLLLLFIYFGNCHGQRMEEKLY